MNDFITIKDVCDFFKVSEMTVLRWRESGLPSYKVGRRVYFDRQEVNEWVKGKKQ